MGAGMAGFTGALGKAVGEAAMTAMNRAEKTMGCQVQVAGPGAA